MNAEVSRLKFEREVGSLSSDARPFTEQRGWEVISTSFPSLEVAFKHHRSGRRVGFRFNFAGWPQQPPSLTLFDPLASDRPELPWSAWPKGGWSAGDNHPTTHKPFLCLPGIREYHTHTSHLNDAWAGLMNRDSYSLVGIVERVRQRFQVTDG